MTEPDPTPDVDLADFFVNVKVEAVGTVTNPPASADNEKETPE